MRTGSRVRLEARATLTSPTGQAKLLGPAQGSITIEPVSARPYGAVYTPDSIVQFLANWAVRTPSDRILEPSAGDGAFIREVVGQLRQLGCEHPSRHVYAVELREEEARKARKTGGGVDVRTGSFFDFASSDFPPVTAIVGNPPYVRYQLFTGEPRESGRQRAIDQGVEMSALASSWAHFVVHASSFLLPDAGRMALVLPAELLHADYAEAVRSLLLRRFRSLTVIALDERAFAPVLVDAVLLLADQEGPPGLRVVRVRRADDLNRETVDQAVRHDSWTGRWDALLHRDSLDDYAAMRSSDRYIALGELASVDIGVVTGANKFFILDDTRRLELAIEPDALSPIVVRGRHLSGVIVDESETKWLLDLGGRPHAAIRLPVRRYIAGGRSNKIHEGYKTGLRKHWWVVPLPKKRGDLLMSYMHQSSPRLIANPNRWWSSNLVHSVRLREPGDAVAVAVASLSATFAFSSEVEGRTYGGGVLKLEPSEAERVLIPKLTAREAGLLRDLAPAVDVLVRGGNRREASLLVDRTLNLDHERYAIRTASLQQRRQHLGQGNRGVQRIDTLHPEV